MENEMTFKDIMDDLLQAVVNTNEEEFDKVLETKAQEYGLNDEDMQELKEVDELLSKIDMKADDIKKAKESGMSKDKFLRSELERLAEGKTKEEQLALAEAFTNTLSTQRTTNQ